MVVVDASALLEVLLATPVSEPIFRRLFVAGETLHAPHLIDVEVAQVLRRYSARREIAESRAETALQDLVDLPMTRYPHDVFLPRIWELRQNLTAYDAAYVALAEGLSAPLVTRDRRIAESGVHRASVEVL